MTISRGWPEVWKKENGGAFSPKCRHAIDVAFIDGQIKLMKAMSITTWKELVYWNFASPIKRHFASGASTVVLAFDDYTHVPEAKNMTQTKRVRHVPDAGGHPNESLPATIPENWSQCIMNRTFKTKVIRFIAETVPKLVTLAPGQRLIVDHQGHPLQYTTEGPGLLEDVPPAGEADVKFARYARLGRMLVEATDGDYIPIALLHLERQGETAPDISLYRMEINLNGPKRTRDGDVKYTYEHLHVNTLLAQLRATILLKLGRRPERLGGAAGAEMRVLAALITYTGCDFSKGLPYLTPRRIWDNLGVIWRPLAEALDPASGTLDVDLVRDRVVARLYAIAYRRHVASENADMARVAERLKRCPPCPPSYCSLCAPKPHRSPQEVPALRVRARPPPGARERRLRPPQRQLGRPVLGLPRDLPRPPRRRPLRLRARRARTPPLGRRSAAHRGLSCSI